MAEYNLDNPIMFLTGEVDTTSIHSRYLYDDGADLGPSGSNIGLQYALEVTNIDPQSIGSSDTRSEGTRQYTGLDIKTGDWVTDASGQKCLQIIRILEKTETSISLIVEDIDAFSYKNYRANSFIPGSNVAFFEISDSGKPLIGGEDSVTFFGENTIATDQLQSRFALREEDEKFRMVFDTPQTSIEEGMVVTIDSQGDLVPLGTPGASNYKLGIVMKISYGDTIVYIKPFNTIINDFQKPEKLTGSAGDIYYASTVTPGEITTNSANGSARLYYQFKDAIPTVVTSTLVNNQTLAGDTLVVNEVPCVSGARKTAEIVSDINANTSQHNVVASNPLVETTAQSYDNKLNPLNGDVVLVLSADGGVSTTPPSVTISDGTNSATIVFRTSDTQFPGTGGAYLTISANQMVQDINAELVANSVDIVASTSVSQGNNPTYYPGLKLTAGAGKAINITNGNADAATQDFLGATAIPANTSATTDSILTLTRADGGDILLTGQGTFVNSNGIVSSSVGTPALLLLIEDEVSASATQSQPVRQTEGIPYDGDQDLVPGTTSSDGDSSGLTISKTPHGDGMVVVLVNGLGVGVGDGTKAAGCYFSGDLGVTARAMADIVAGDGLYWNGSIAGYELDSGDSIDLNYEQSV